jgi:hypothetical protein
MESKRALTASSTFRPVLAEVRKAGQSNSAAVASSWARVTFAWSTRSALFPRMTRGIRPATLSTASTHAFRPRRVWSRVRSHTAKIPSTPLKWVSRRSSLKPLGLVISKISKMKVTSLQVFKDLSWTCFVIAVAPRVAM